MCYLHLHERIARCLRDWKYRNGFSSRFAIDLYFKPYWKKWLSLRRFLASLEISLGLFVRRLCGWESFVYVLRCVCNSIRALLAAPLGSRNWLKEMAQEIKALVTKKCNIDLSALSLKLATQLLLMFVLTLPAHGHSKTLRFLSHLIVSASECHV